MRLSPFVGSQLIWYGKEFFFSILTILTSFSALRVPDPDLKILVRGGDQVRLLSVPGDTGDQLVAALVRPELGDGKVLEIVEKVREGGGVHEHVPSCVDYLFVPELAARGEEVLCD